MCLHLMNLLCGHSKQCPGDRQLLGQTSDKRALWPKTLNLLQRSGTVIDSFSFFYCAKNFLILKLTEITESLYLKTS